MASKTPSKTGKPKRYRHYATTIYKESAKDRWQERLEQEFVSAFISPYHDKDVNPTGEPKKPHYHVMIMFDGVKTKEQAKEIFDNIGGVGCEIINSLRGYARYLCHMDNPDKHQYNIDDVKQLSGADYHGVIGLALDKYKAISDMIDFCESNDFISYSDLLIYCRNERFDWFRILCDNGTYVIKEYLKSRNWTSQIKDSVKFEKNNQENKDDNGR